MRFIEDAIVEACSATGCSVEKLSDETSTAIRKCIEDKYAGYHRQSPLWERLEGDISKHDPDGWRAIAEFPFNDRVTMFFDRENESTMYSVNSCNDVVKLLSECPGFVFYLTDCECSFLLCYNDHDYLIGAGMAKDWVGSR